MFETLKARLEEVQQIGDRLPDAAIAVATELRQKVRASKRKGQRDRRDMRIALRVSGFTPKEVRARVRVPRRGSGISIDGESTGSSIAVVASTQVQHFRRLYGETTDLLAIFARHMSLVADYRRRKGGR
jgi:hypothetical protein